MDHEPRYGLSLYLHLDAEIEHVCMLESCVALGLARDETLEVELETSGIPQLYLVPEASMKPFRARMHMLGLSGQELGQVQGLILVEIR